MRILVLADEFHPDAVGGISKSLFNECSAWIRAGHQVTVIVRSLRPELPPTSQEAGIHIIRFQGPPRSHRFYRLYPLTIFSKATRLLRQHIGSFDLIYLHNPLYMIPVRLSGAHRHAPVIYTYFAPVAEELRVLAQRGKYGSFRLLANMAASLFGWIETWALRRADYVTPRSIYARDNVKTRGDVTVWSPETPVPLGVDTDRYAPSPGGKIDARGSLDLPQSRLILLTVRRLEARMGLTNLVEAMRTISASHPDTLLLMVGKGYLHDTLEKMIADNDLADKVRLLGFVPEAELPLYIAAADLFVLPTEFLEGFGLATIEALAVGLPVVGTPVGATPEILSAIDPALVTRDATPEALAEGIIHWLDRPEELASLSDKCRSEVLTHYNADLIAGQLAGLFEQAVEEHRQRK